MRILISALWLVSLVAPETAVAQAFPPNEAGVTMGHWHLNSVSVEANQKILVGWIKAWVTTPDGLRIEVLEDKSQTMPIRHAHIQFFVEEAVIPQMQAWYVKHFGAKPGVRNEAPVADIPGTQLRFNKSATPTVTTKGRVLERIGFDVTDLRETLKRLEAAGVKIDRPYTPNPLTGDGLAFIYDPWGIYIELNERKKPL